MASLRDGCILIDEIENGLHHSLFAPLMRAVLSHARKNNNQVFVATHSNEFIERLTGAASDDNAGDIAFFRLNKRGLRGAIPRYSLAEAQDILEANLDIR